MADKPSHLEEVPATGPTFQEMAVETDSAVFGMMTELRAGHPGLGGAIVAGTVGGLTRYQLQAMPEGSSAQQVLEVLAPIIRNVAGQIVEEQRKRLGRPVPKVPVVAPQKTAFDKLHAELAAAPFPTYCISSDGRLVLVSMILAADGVLSHASVANLEGATHRPAEVIHAHCRAAAIRWKADTELLENIRAERARHEEAATAAHGKATVIAHNAAVEALQRVEAMIENPEGGTHVQ